VICVAAMRARRVRGEAIDGDRVRAQRLRESNAKDAGHDGVTSGAPPEGTHERRVCEEAEHIGQLAATSASCAGARLGS